MGLSAVGLSAVGLSAVGLSAVGLSAVGHVLCTENKQVATKLYKRARA